MPTTPATTILRPNQPPAPGLMRINTDWDPMIPELRLPSPVAHTRNVLLPTMILDPPSSATNHFHLKHANAVPTHATADEQLQMTIAGYHSESTIQPAASIDCAPSEAHQ